jgi:hypothetical protein
VNADYYIESPIWNYKGGRAVGLALDKLPDEEFITVEITYKNKKGERLYPRPFRVNYKDVVSGERKVLRGGRELCIVPLSKMEVL